MIVLGIIICIYAIVMGILGTLNMGLFALFAVGAGLIVYSRFRMDILQKNGWVRVVRYLCYAGFAAFLILSLCLFLYGSKSGGSYDEDAVIVLGAGVIGDRVSQTLANRLDLAVEYHLKNPSAKIVVSGGKGAQESDAEGKIMKKYLVARGISPKQIISEEKATSTYENFIYSKPFLEDCKTCAYITNHFHVFRAGWDARRAGFDACGYGAKDVWYSIPINYVREAMAIVKTLLFPRT